MAGAARPALRAVDDDPVAIDPGASVEGATVTVELPAVVADSGSDKCWRSFAFNASDGLFIASSRNQIGGSKKGRGNIVSGNDSASLVFSGTLAQLNALVGSEVAKAEDKLFARIKVLKTICRTLEAAL